MTLNEFKVWLEGFCEAVGEAPTPEQWAKVQARLATVRTFGGIPASPVPTWPPTTVAPRPLSPYVTAGGTISSPPNTWVSSNGFCGKLDA